MLLGLIHARTRHKRHGRLGQHIPQSNIRLARNVKQSPRNPETDFFQTETIIRLMKLKLNSNP